MVATLSLLDQSLHRRNAIRLNSAGSLRVVVAVSRNTPPELQRISLDISMKAVRYVRWFVLQIARQFREDGCSWAAAALTFTTMIAVVPFFAIVYRILSLLPGFEGVGDTISSFVFETFLPGSSNVVVERIQEFSTKATQLTIVGIGIVIVSTMAMLMRMEEAFNHIWHVTNTRTAFTRFLSYWGIITLGVPMIGVAVTAASYDFGLSYLTELRASPHMETIRTVIPPVATTLTFTLLYYAVPSCRVRFVHALAGGVVMSLLFAGSHMKPSSWLYLCSRSPWFTERLRHCLCSLWACTSFGF